MSDRKPAPPTCSKCDGYMEGGYMQDMGVGALPRIAWVKGRPRTKLSIMLRPWAKKDIIRYITTLRCIECGYLESYAPPR